MFGGRTHHHFYRPTILTSLILRRSPTLRSSGAAKPGWHVSRQQRWGPEIPDNQYYWDHPTYTGFVLWLRGIRPYIEKLLGDGYKTARHLIVDCGVNPIKDVIIKHNPDFRLVSR